MSKGSKGSKRRGSGEGSIYQREDGRWMGAVNLGGGVGGQKRTRRYVSGKTRQEVQRKLAELRREVEAGRPVVGERQTVAQYLTGWLADVRVQVRPSTYARYESVVRVHLVPRLGGLRLATLAPRHVQQLVSELMASGMKPSTAQIVQGILHRALEDGARLEILPRNVASLVRAPRRGKASVDAWTEEEARQFLEYVRTCRRAGSLRAYVYYTLALSIGMRRGELLGLKWSSVDLSRETGLRVEVVAQAINLSSDPRKRWIDELKTASSRRVIRLDERVAQVLREHKARQDRQRLLVGSAWVETGLVFTNDVGEILPDHVVGERPFHRYVFEAGVRQIRPHDMRHTAATIALRRGVSVKEVAEMLGHASVKMTLDRYTHLLPDMQRVAANRIADALFG